VPQSVAVTYAINYLLIPRLLFRRRYFLFVYCLLVLIVFSVWSNMLSLVTLLFWADLQIIPTVKDFVVVLAGNYVIVFFAVIVHLLLSAFRVELEKEALAKQQLQTELKLNEANLALLKGQIHPHFLFNMLNNVYGLCLSDSDRAGEVVLQISNLLDYMLYKCNQVVVELVAEIGFLEDYIALECMRADERLLVDFRVQKGEIENVLIPPLLLFPFVENAFKHSAVQNIGNRKIEIVLETKAERLSLWVQNNFELHDDPKRSGGLGLLNVRKRLGLMLEDDYSLEIQEQEKLFTVCLEFGVERYKK